MAEAQDIDVDNIIEQLLTVRGSRPGRQVNLTEAEIRWLCIKSREIFTVQPVLLELEAPIKICGNKLPLFSCALLLILSCIYHRVGNCYKLNYFTSLLRSSYFDCYVAFFACHDVHGQC